MAACLASIGCAPHRGGDGVGDADPRADEPATERDPDRDGALTGDTERAVAGRDAPAVAGDAGEMLVSALKLPGAGIATGWFQGCIIRGEPQLHDVYCNVRALPPPGLQGLQITASHHHVCSINLPGKRTAGQPEGVTCFIDSPDHRDLLPPANLKVDPVQVSAAEDHTCVLNRNGTVTCWGLNASANTPPKDLRAKLVAASGLMNCAIRDDKADPSRDDSVICWGRMPVQPPSALRARRVAIGNEPDYAQPPTFYRHACAIDLDNKISCWGDNGHGETTVPLIVQTKGAKELGLGHAFSCAVLLDGTGRCWGTVGWTPWDQAAADALKTGQVKGISASGTLICVVKADNTVVGCGASGSKVFVPE